MTASAAAGWRRPAARVVVALAAFVAVASSWRSLVEAKGLTEAAWERRYLDYPLAADYLFGSDYLASIRDIRERVPEDATLYFIVAEDTSNAATYFALHYLAPRRLVGLGIFGERSLGWLRRHVPAGVEEILWIEDVGKPLRLVRVESLPVSGGRGAR